MSQVERPTADSKPFQVTPNQVRWLGYSLTSVVLLGEAYFRLNRYAMAATLAVGVVYPFDTSHVYFWNAQRKTVVPLNLPPRCVSIRPVEEGEKLFVTDSKLPEHHGAGLNFDAMITQFPNVKQAFAL